jgi:hypothetical protein
MKKDSYIVQCMHHRHMETSFFPLLNDWYFFMESKKRSAERKAQCCSHAKLLPEINPQCSKSPPPPTKLKKNEKLASASQGGRMAFMRRWARGAIL